MTRAKLVGAWVGQHRMQHKLLYWVLACPESVQVCVVHVVQEQVGWIALGLCGSCGVCWEQLATTRAKLVGTWVSQHRMQHELLYWVLACPKSVQVCVVCVVQEQVGWIALGLCGVRVGWIALGPCGSCGVCWEQLATTRAKLVGA
jgi:hypothetical protein